MNAIGFNQSGIINRDIYQRDLTFRDTETYTILSTLEEIVQMIFQFLKTLTVYLVL
jgi:hypothetical protein